MSTSDDQSNSTDVEVGVATRKKVIDKRLRTLPRSADPFAPRQGKTLIWRNINMFLVNSMDL